MPAFSAKNQNLFRQGRRAEVGKPTPEFLNYHNYYNKLVTLYNKSFLSF